MQEIRQGRHPRQRRCVSRHPGREDQRAEDQRLPEQCRGGAPAGAPDRDKDGIPDSLDACPDTPGVKQADMHKNGCPLPAALGPWGSPVGSPDRDKDGIADDLDACPDTPGVKQADMHKNGCPLPAALGPWGSPVGSPDRDKDGIADDLNMCPDTPGVKQDDPHKNGCPIANNPWGAPAGASDRDKDGVPDSLDACPDVVGIKTTDPKTNGCPNNPWGAPAGASDRDKDNVPDAINACPDAAGVKTDRARDQRLPAQSVGRARRRLRSRQGRRSRYARRMPRRRGREDQPTRRPTAVPPARSARSSSVPPSRSSPPSRRRSRRSRSPRPRRRPPPPLRRLLPSRRRPLRPLRQASGTSRGRGSEIRFRAVTRDASCERRLAVLALAASSALAASWAASCVAKRPCAGSGRGASDTTPSSFMTCSRAPAFASISTCRCPPGDRAGAVDGLRARARMAGARREGAHRRRHRRCAAATRDRRRRRLLRRERRRPIDRASARTSPRWCVSWRFAPRTTASWPSPCSRVSELGATLVTRLALEPRLRPRAREAARRHRDERRLRRTGGVAPTRRRSCAVGARDSPASAQSSRRLVRALERAGAKDVHGHYVSLRDAHTLTNLAGDDERRRRRRRCLRARRAAPRQRSETAWALSDTWGPHAPLTTETFWKDERLVVRRPTDARFRAAVRNVFGEMARDLEQWPIATYDAIDLGDYLRAHPELGTGRLARGDERPRREARARAQRNRP